MKAGRILIVLLLVAAAGVGGWFAGQRAHSHSLEEPGSGKKLRFYQSPMHPWIKSDKPGNCTICGMALTPDYEGEKGFDTAADVVSLSTNQISVINVQTEPAVERVLDKRLSVAGRIEADETRLRAISAYVDGRVEKLAINYTGAEVQAGQPLVEIYSPMLLTAQRELNTLLVGVPSTNSARLREEHERLLAGTKLRLKRLGLTDEQIEQLQHEPATNLTTKIVAPISGTVLTKSVVEGQYVKEGDKLFEVADLSRMWFRFEVYEQDLVWVQPGQMVQVTIPALGNETFDGTVRFIEPTVNDMTRSARVRVELDNPIVEDAAGQRRALYNNLYAQGQISFKTKPVLAVSRRAVLNPGDRARVYVENDGVYQQRVVKLGRKGGQHWEVLEGIEAGEKIVTEGNLMIDSQAELNRGANPQAEPQETSGPIPTKVAKVEVSDEQFTKAEALLLAAAQTSEALAADNTAAYTASLPRLVESFHAAHGAFGGSPLHAVIDKAGQFVDLKAGDDLEEIRKGFLPFSNALAAFTVELRKHKQIPAKVFKCPMYPKVGQTAFWVQSGATTRNPFYGAEMHECGSEVKGTP